MGLGWGEAGPDECPVSRRQVKMLFEYHSKHIRSALDDLEYDLKQLFNPRSANLHSMKPKEGDDNGETAA